MKSSLARGLPGLLGVIILTVASHTAVGAPLNLSPSNPDIEASNLVIGYDYTKNGPNAGLGLFTVTSAVPDNMSIRLDSGLEGPFDGEYSLSATFQDGAFVSGSLTITALEAFSSLAWSANDVLIQADIVDFGFAGFASAGVLEFELANITGVLGGFGSDGGVVMNTTITSGIPLGNWDTDPDFLLKDFSGNGFSDNYVVVPLPGAAWLFFSALAGIGALKRGRAS
jgi:hypothetical protein